VWEKPGPKIMADPQELQRRERGSARGFVEAFAAEAGSSGKGHGYSF
jgi:hypothetical protein